MFGSGPRYHKSPSVRSSASRPAVPKIKLYPLNGGWAFPNTIDYPIPATVS